MSFNYFWQYKHLTDLKTFGSDIDTYFDDYLLGNVTNLETAFGWSLDLIGKIIGVDRRPVLLKPEGMIWDQSLWDQDEWSVNSPAVVDSFISDPNFRKILTIRSEQLLTARNLDSLLRFLDEILPDLVYIYSFIENQVTVTYNLSSTNDEEDAILNGGYILVPQGCELIINGV